MKRILLAFLIVFVILVGCSKKPTVASSEENEDKQRSLTIINKTDQIINDVKVYIDDTPVENYKNPDFKNPIVYVIPERFEEHTQFTVEFTDRYDYVYSKTITIEDKVGRKEVVIEKKDQKQKGDWLSKIFNDD